MKLSRLLLMCIILKGIVIESKQKPCAFVTCINCPNDCDNRTQFEECDGNLYAKTFFSYRPQDSDSSRRILDWFNADYKVPCLTTNTSCTDVVEGAVCLLKPSKSDVWQFPWHNILTISAQWTRSFNRHNIAQWFFFNGEDAMTVGIPNGCEIFDINGSQIGLSLGDTGYEDDSLISGKIGNVWARPVVENFILDFDYWHDLGTFKDGLWIRFMAPLVYMKTHMDLRAFGRGNNQDPYPMGFMTLEGVGTTTCGTTPVPYRSILCALQGNQGWGAVKPLECGKFPLCTQTKWGVAGLHMDLGYDFYKSDTGYSAVSMQVVFPTGTRPKSTYILEPIIGANKSWQFGGTFIAHHIKEMSNNKQLGFYAYAVGTHLFKSKQERVFALKNNGPGSQYLLVKQFSSAGDQLVGADRIANIFCGSTKIGATFMFDGSCMLQFSRDAFVADIGYNLWVRTKENRAKTVCFRGFYKDELGIKGNQPMEDHISAIDCNGNDVEVCLFNLNTESAAILACLSVADTVATFIQPCDVEFGSALSPTVISNKIFGALGFKSSWFALLSAEVELSSNNAALNQWGIMLKVGKEF